MICDSTVRAWDAFETSTVPPEHQSPLPGAGGRSSTYSWAAGARPTPHGRVSTPWHFRGSFATDRGELCGRSGERDVRAPKSTDPLKAAVSVAPGPT